MSSSEHCRWAIFQIYSAQNLKITRITTFLIRNVVYQAGSRWDPKCVFKFLRFFERKLYKSNYIIFILSWCGTHPKIRSTLVDIVTAGSQKITFWGPQRTPLGILRVNFHSNKNNLLSACQVFYYATPKPQPWVTAECCCTRCRNAGSELRQLTDHVQSTQRFMHAVFENGNFWMTFK